jgi:hypothetical protein
MYASGPTMAILVIDLKTLKSPCAEKIFLRPFSGLMRSGFGLSGLNVRFHAGLHDVDGDARSPAASAGMAA